jgi:hypothetical protein
MVGAPPAPTRGWGELRAGFQPTLEDETRVRIERLGFGGVRPERILSPKWGKSRRRITGLRSKTTKARTCIDCLPPAELEKQIEARTRELSEAREQRAGTTEVLQVPITA